MVLIGISEVDTSPEKKKFLIGSFAGSAHRCANPAM
jgi:hypothetical protein